MMVDVFERRSDTLYFTVTSSIKRSRGSCLRLDKFLCVDFCEFGNPCGNTRTD